MKRSFALTSSLGLARLRLRVDRLCPRRADREPVEVGVRQALERHKGELRGACLALARRHGHEVPGMAAARNAVDAGPRSPSRHVLEAFVAAVSGGARCDLAVGRNTHLKALPVVPMKAWPVLCQRPQLAADAAGEALGVVEP